MTVFLRQSTAIDVAIGPFVDDTDGKTAETGLTLSQADIRLKKNAAAWAQVSDNTAAAHEENGWYEKELDATDTNTVGRLLIAIHESGALPVWHEFFVLEEAVFDSLFAASGDNNIASIADLPTNAELATALGTADDAVLTAVAAVPTAAANAAALMDLANGIETGVTPRQALRLVLAAAAGKLSGATTATVTIRNAGDTKDRITATVDSNGNRTAVTTDGT